MHLGTQWCYTMPYHTIPCHALHHDTCLKTGYANLYVEGLLQVSKVCPISLILLLDPFDIERFLFAFYESFQYEGTALNIEESKNGLYVWIAKQEV